MSLATVSSHDPVSHEMLCALVEGEDVYARVYPGERGKGWRIRTPWGWIYGAYSVERGRRIRFTRKEAADYIAGQINQDVTRAVARGGDPREAAARWLPSVRPETLLGARAERWLELQARRVAAGDLSPTYLRELRRHLDPDGWMAPLARMAPSEVRAGTLEDWSLHLADRGIGPNTRRKALQSLRTLLGWLYDREEITRVPRPPRIEVPEYEPTILSPEDQARVVASIPVERRGAFIALCHGIRPGEARALNVEDYDRREGVLRVRFAMKGRGESAPRGPTKERTARAVEVDAELRDWLAVHGATQPIGGPLFRNPKGRAIDRRWSDDALRLAWNQAADRCGLRVGLYEGTKHTSATNALRRGASLTEIQAALGHADERSTRRYARIAKRARVETLRPRTKPTQAGEES